MTDKNYWHIKNDRQNGLKYLDVCLWEKKKKLNSYHLKDIRSPTPCPERFWFS